MDRDASTLIDRNDLETGTADVEASTARVEDRANEPRRPSARERQSREDREDREFDAELREIESEKTNAAEAIVEEDVIEVDENGSRTETVAVSAYEASAPSASEPETRDEAAPPAERDERDEAAETPEPAKSPRKRGSRGGRKKKAEPAASEEDSAPSVPSGETLFVADEAPVPAKGKGRAKPKPRSTPRGKGRAKAAAETAEPTPEASDGPKSSSENSEPVSTSDASARPPRRLPSLLFSAPVPPTATWQMRSRSTTNQSAVRAIIGIWIRFRMITIEALT